MSEARETADLYPSIVEGVGSGTGNFYRTGTFVPVWSSDDATDVTASITTGTYQVQHGVYIRIGDLVFYQIHIKSPTTWTYTNGGATGQSVRLVGLPFTSASSNGASEQWSGSVSFFDNISFTASYSLKPLVRNNTDYIRFYYNSGNTSSRFLTTSIDEADSEVFVTGSYRTEDA